MTFTSTELIRNRIISGIVNGHILAIEAQNIIIDQFINGKFFSCCLQLRLQIRVDLFRKLSVRKIEFH